MHRLSPTFVGEADLGGRLAQFGSMRDSVRLRTAFIHWNVPKKYGLHGELLLSLVSLWKSGRASQPKHSSMCLDRFAHDG